MSSKRTISLLLLLFAMWSSKTSNAQFFGGNAPSIKWQSIDTDTLRIIFPIGLEKEATHVANVIGYISKNGTGSVGPKVRKLKLVFQNKTLIPNGYVTLAPFMSEFFVTPPQDLQMLGSLSWLDALAVHEYRHALQFANHKRRVVNLLYLLNGETGWVAGEVLLFPPWYYEGDAVTTETALTSAGRGRTPSFLAPLRSMASENITIPYVTLRNGSYKQNLPNHYAYGYLMSTHGREMYGNDFWMRVSRSTTNLRGVFFPFGNSVKKYSKVRPPCLYRNAMQGFASTWDNYSNRQPIVEGSELVEQKGKAYCSYVRPILLGDTSVLAIRENFSHLPQIVRVDRINDREEVLVTLGSSIDGWYSYNAGKIAWSELHFHPRWQNQTTNSIYIYSMDTRKVTKLVSNARYLSPALSPDGKRLAVVSISSALEYSTLILDAKTGGVLETLPNPEGYEFFTPSWNGDASLVMVAKRQGKLAIVAQDVPSGTIKMLHGWTSHVIANPLCTNGSVYFEASYGGVDNIYKLNLGSGAMVKATSAQVGANQPSMANGKIAYSRYSLRGNRLMILKDGELAEPLTKITEPVDESIFHTKPIEWEGGAMLDSIPRRNYPVTRYRPMEHLLNIHSWALVSMDNVSGIQVTSTDVLNTLNVQGAIFYNDNDRSTSYVANVIYGGLYPYIGGSLQRFSNREPFMNPLGIRWDETVAAASIQLPLNFSSRIFSQKLTFDASIENYSVEYTGFFVGGIDFTTVSGGVSFSNLRLRARQNLNPRWGQAVSANYRKIVSGDYSGKFSTTLHGSLFFPGIAQNHSLSFNAAFREESDIAPYRFSDTTTISRGYSLPEYNRFTRLSAQYSMPLLYPDFGVNGLGFVKRLRTNLFYDYTTLRFNAPGQPWSEFNSCGVELVVDMTLFNLVELPIGARYSILFNKDVVDSKRRDYIEFFVRITSL